MKMIDLFKLILFIALCLSIGLSFVYLFARIWIGAEGPTKKAKRVHYVHHDVKKPYHTFSNKEILSASGPIHDEKVRQELIERRIQKAPTTQINKDRKVIEAAEKIIEEAQQRERRRRGYE